MPLPALEIFERKIGRQLRLLDIRKTIIERKIERHLRLFEQKRGPKKKVYRLDDEVRFIRSWIERPLSTGAVTPSGKILPCHAAERITRLSFASVGDQPLAAI